MNAYTYWCPSEGATAPRRVVRAPNLECAARAVARAHAPDADCALVRLGPPDAARYLVKALVPFTKTIALFDEGTS